MILFMQDWWMDAVCQGKHWERIAGMPCLLRQRMGFRYVIMPQQTQIGGTFLPAAATPEEIRTKADEITRELAARGLDYYYQHFPIGSPLPELLEKRGFQIRKHTTYRIEDLHDIAAVEQRFSENKRRQIRKAADLQLVELTPDRFYAFHTDCLRQQGKQIAYSEAFFHSLDSACAAHNARQIIALQDAKDNLHAAVFLAFDAETCYFLIPCYSSAYKNSGAGARIVAEAIRFAAMHSQVFDFEGSMIPGVANHYAQFGSTPAYFYEVERFYNPLFRLVLPVYQLLTRHKR